VDASDDSGRLVSGGSVSAEPTISYVRLVRVTVALSSLLPLIVILCSSKHVDVAMRPTLLITVAVLAPTLALVAWGAGALLRRLEPVIDRFARSQASFLDDLPSRWVPAAIILSASASLALELTVIRWQGTVWEVFALYKNFSLLSCFAGLGLGYALARKDRIPSVLTLPLVAFQALLLVSLRYKIPWQWITSLRSTPVTEQLNMGLTTTTDVWSLVAIYSFLGASMLLTALPFIPLGQICGRLLDRAAPLRAYGFNLLGSLAGVGLILVLGTLWTPPSLWFMPCLTVLILLQSFNRRSILFGIVFALAAIAVLDWPVTPGTERIHSPYQLLERGPGNRGLSMIAAAGHYYQRVLDLSPAAVSADPGLTPVARYYEMPYRLHGHPQEVAVVGAGTGNDVAAGLRLGADRIDAIEIDPAILRLGDLYHPEQPYESPKVNRIVNDARTFLRNTSNRYDLIVYGLLDSHTLLSQASSVRLDSFVYTVEGLREARARLKDDGVLSLSFCVLSPRLGRKIFLMMTEAFDGATPICIHTRYDGSVIFAQSKQGGLTPDPRLLQDTGFKDVTASIADSRLRADISTDDWPFLYMPERVYPRSYLGMILLVLALTFVLFRSFIRQSPGGGMIPFGLLGAGFMLVETKAITEMGLLLGNTWQVIGVVIAAILSMAFLANAAVMHWEIRRPGTAMALLLVSLGIGFAVAVAGGLPATAWGKVTAVVVVTCPMFFSGIAFSTLLARTKDVSMALAMNLFGAMCGGLLEYNSMYFGFRFLYVIAALLYGATLCWVLLGGRRSCRLPEM